MSIRTRNKRILAAVDIGSNSIHMTLAKKKPAGFQILKRLGRKVQLAAGLNDVHQLSQEAKQRGLACLREIAHELPELDAQQIQIVATCALRQAHNRAEFIDEAEQILGHPIELISGEEEASLIYLGAAKATLCPERHLVIDIGGGSTELIVGDGLQPLLLKSVELGCVHFSQHFFAQKIINAAHFDQAIEAARTVLAPLATPMQQLGWQRVSGTSGTVHAATQVLQKQGLTSDLTRTGLEQLRSQLCAQGHVDAIDFAGLKAERRSIFVGGVAILLALFSTLGIEKMHYVDAALREGVLWRLAELNG
ncbi:MAG: Exopolyphosphatase [Pseudomonadota bacterium]